VAQFWNTTDIRANHAPVVGVTFMLHRDGSVTGIRISQRSGISALDLSAQRAVMDAAPFPQLPPQFPKNQAEIEFLFQLKQ
jgi:protein TonB